jgi:hypothetical protein
MRAADSNRQNPAIRALRMFMNTLPVLLGMLLLTSLVLASLPMEEFQALFQRHAGWDVVLGALIGSVAAGNPVAGYVFGGELLAADVSLTAVTALIVAWVSVGLVQLPVEALLLGRRFALIRNLFGFLSAIVIAYLATGLLRVTG